MQELILKSKCLWIPEVNNHTPLSSSPRTNGVLPFAGLTICVTGLSKEARKQVQLTTERLGGIYSPDLHPGCTHLVVQRSAGRKFEHALRSRSRKGLFVVTLAWFVNSARRNERLNESQYDATKVSSEIENAVLQEEPTCIPQSLSNIPSSKTNIQITRQPSERKLLAGVCLYIDKDVSSDMQIKVVEAAVREGGTCLSDWYIGCNATHIVCEDTGLVNYIGYRIHLVSPMWVLRTVKEHIPQHLVHISLDLARHFPHLLDQQKPKQTTKQHDGFTKKKNVLALCAQEDAKTRQQAEATIRAAKESIRRRRGPGKQPCRSLPRPITPQSMMESICWSISEPPSTAQLYLDNSEGIVLHDQGSDDYFDAHESGRESNNEVYVRALSDSEKNDVVYKGSYLTILFPLDRYSEMGPSSRPFFSEKGFTRQQILENVYTFYQECMTPCEIEVALYTDSKHAERLRAVYAAPETLDAGYVRTRRYEFLGSRRNFEGLRRLSVENNGQVYQLCLGS